MCPYGGFCGGGGWGFIAGYIDRHYHHLFQCRLAIDSCRELAMLVSVHSEVALASRIAWLLHTQNPDGGWGYRPGKSSWLEPTVYALRAFSGEAMRGALPRRIAESCRNATQYIDRLQRTDGSWQAAAGIFEGHWSGALWLGLVDGVGGRSGRTEAGLRWLLAAKGAEGGWAQRMGAWMDPHAVEQDRELRGWPWIAGTNSWVEPTCHALLALSKAQRYGNSEDLTTRISEGQRLLLDRRCSDNGWNYGNRRVRGCDLPGYPETTALALLALKSCGAGSLELSVAYAQRCWEAPALPRRTKLWLALALWESGIAVKLEEGPCSSETVTVALEAVARMPGRFA